MKELINSDWFKEKRKILTLKGYTERYYEFLAEGKTGMKAFEAVEKEHVEIFGIKKYTSVKSFMESVGRERRKKSNNSGH